MALWAPKRRGLRGPRWPIWPLFEILGGPWDPLFRPLGRPETPSRPRNKNLKRLLGPPRGRQPTYFLGKNAFRKKKRKKYTKNRCVQNLVRRSFSEASKIDFLAARRVPEARYKNSYRKKGAQISELYAWLRSNHIPRKEARVAQKRTFLAQRGPQRPFQTIEIA